MTQTDNQEDSLIANIDHIKQVNTASIYKVIEKNAPISRVKIAKISKLAPASVTKITRQLLEKGIICETAIQASTGGRCAISLAPNIDNIHVLAVKIGQKTLSLSCYNLAAQQLSTSEITIKAEDQRQLLDLLFTSINCFIIKQKKQDQTIAAISLSLSGLIDPQKGIVVYSPYYPLVNFPLAATIEQRFSLPTFIGNHTRSLALAEHYFGASKDCLDSILISIHHGVGSGIIINGKPLLGQHFNIGEIGHIQANPAGKRCHCGNFGCLETEVSDSVIIEKVRKAIKQGCHSALNLESLNIEKIYQAAADNDPLCRKIVEEAATYLGKTIAILINIFNPQKIIIAGKISAAQTKLLSPIEQCIAYQVLPNFQNKVHIETSLLKQESTLAAFSLLKQAIYEGDLLQRMTPHS